MDADDGLSAVDSNAGGDDGGVVEYEFGFDSDESGEHGQPQALAPAPAPIAEAPDPRDTRIAALERQNQETLTQLQPLMSYLYREQQQRTEKPPFSPEQLDTDPNLKPSDLLRYLQWQSQQQAGQITTQAEMRSRAILSEQQARGQFSREMMGEGLDYDSLVNRHVGPLVSQNPLVDALIHQVMPGDPAAGRMIVATVLACVEAAKGDLVAGIKGALQGFRSMQTATAQTAQQRTKNVSAAKRPIFGNQRNTLTTGKREIKTAEDAWNLSAKEHTRAMQQLLSD